MDFVDVHTFIISVPTEQHFQIKMNANGNIKEYYLKDLIHRNKVINMNRDLNVHITEIFDNDMLKHLHQLKISYKSLSKFVIDVNTSEFNIHCYISEVLDIFKSREWVLSLCYHKFMKRLGLANFYHPRYKQGRTAIYTDDEIIERRYNQMKIANLKYSHSDKGKSNSRERSKRYYEKKNALNNILLDDKGLVFN